MAGDQTVRRGTLALLAGVALGLVAVQALLMPGGPLYEIGAPPAAQGTATAGQGFPTGDALTDDLTEAAKQAARGSDEGTGTSPPTAPANPPPPAIRPDRPNFLVIFTDDQNVGTMGLMPHTQELLFDRGITFTQGYVTTPLCCPSRASLLTGQFASNHGVETNFQALEGRTVAHDLREAGYYTGHVGKVFNTWHGAMLPQYDYMAAFAGAQSTYIDPQLFVNGEMVQTEGYITYLFRDHVLTFVDQASQRDQPFLMMFWTNAPHNPAESAPEHEHLYTDLPPVRPPSFQELDMSDKPAWMQTLPPLTSEWEDRRHKLVQRQARTLHSLDIAIQDILTGLEEREMLDDTVVFFLSDNGIQNGEHRLLDKGWPYQESIHVPFAMLAPALIPTPRIESALVANVDVTATIYDLANVTPSRPQDGRSLMPVVTGEGDWREALYLEGWPKDAPAWQAVHTGGHVYIEWDDGSRELYDLGIDPYQLQSVAGTEAYSDKQAEMAALLDRLAPP